MISSQAKAIWGKTTILPKTPLTLMEEPHAENVPRDVGSPVHDEEQAHATVRPFSRKTFPVS